MIILHGENTVESSKRLVSISEDFKNKGVQVNNFEQNELTVGKLRQELSPADLFGNTSFLIIKGLLSGAKSKSKDKIIDYLKSENPQNVLLFEPKSVHPSTVKQFKGATVESFKVDINIFKFVEKVIPNDTKSLLFAYEDLIGKGAEPEYIFAMLVRQIRILIQLKTSPHLVKLNPYSAAPLKSQAQKFTTDQLLDLHEKLYQIERGIKTGKNPLLLSTLLPHFLEHI
jgi:DNA polymerase III delta subunit